MKTGVLAFLLLAGHPAARAEESIMLAARPAETAGSLTGNLAVDFFGLRGLGDSLAATGSGDEDLPGKKSAVLAGGMSLVVPGTGQIYNGDYWQAALFLVAEAALWTVAAVNDKKGDDQTAFFEAYADDYWDVVRYAEWSDENLAPNGQTFGWLIPGTEGRVPWERVNWTELNRMERAIAATAAGQFYSHTLPQHGEQQYYELIGKYQQFYQGWSDADPALLSYDDIDARLKAGGTQFTYYSAERGKANDYYSAASTAVTLVVVNHVLSALEAAWGASRHNKTLHAQVGLQTLPVPTRATATALKLTWGL
jgi:hypothetical protein